MNQEAEGLVYYPEQEQHFICYPDMYVLVQRMRVIFDEIKAQRMVSDQDALLTAYREAICEKLGFENLASKMKTDSFYEKFAHHIRRSHRYFLGLTKTEFAPMFASLDAFNQVQAATDPLVLFGLATDRVGEGTNDPNLLDDAQRTRQESTRAFAFALQNLSWDVVEPRDVIERSQSLVERQAHTNLFIEGMVKYWVVAETNPEDQGRVSGELLFFESQKEARKGALALRKAIKDKAEQRWKGIVLSGEVLNSAQLTAHTMRMNGKTVHEEIVEWELRRVLIDGEIYEVRYIFSSKDLTRVIEKKDRYCVKVTPWRVVSDRVRWTYIVSSIVGACGVRRAATKADAIVFNEFTRQHFWRGDLEWVEDDAHENDVSHRRYFDVKTVGFAKTSKSCDDVVVAIRCEQIVTTGRYFLSNEITHGGERHSVYRAERLFKYLAPLWWPEITWNKRLHDLLLVAWRVLRT